MSLLCKIIGHKKLILIDKIICRRCFKEISILPITGEDRVRLNMIWKKEK